MLPSELERFEAKVERVTESGCWLWTGHLGRGDYAQMRRRGRHGRMEVAHRIAFEHWRGAIPAGLCLDHLCRVRCCVNPWHVRAVTMRENTLAPGSMAFTKKNADKTHCPSGHELGWRNSYGRRECLTCRSEQRKTEHGRRVGRERMRRWRLAHKTA